MYGVNPGTSWTFYIYANSNGFKFQNNRFIDNTNVVMKSGQSSTTTNLTVTGNYIYNVTGSGQSAMAFGGIGGTSVISFNKIENIAYGGILLDYATSLVIEGNEIINTTQQGIQLATGCGNVSIINNVITNTNTLQTYDKGGIRLYGSVLAGPITITGNTISGSFNGIAIRDGNQNLTGKDIQIHNNNISNNANLGIYVPAGAEGNLVADLNYWGDPSGPYNSNTNTNGTGIGVSDNVIYDCWWANSLMTEMGSNKPVRNVTQNLYYDTIQPAINAATAGDEIQVGPGTYTGNVVITKSLTLISTDGAATTILDGLASDPGLGTIHINTGVNNLTIGTTGHGFHVKGIDGPANLEKAAIYFQGAQNNVLVQGNIIEARGDAGIMGEYNAANTNFTIDNNIITGQTLILPELDSWLSILC